MDEIVAALRAQQAELASYVRDASAADLQRPSRCDGWTVADVPRRGSRTGPRPR